MQKFKKIPENKYFPYVNNKTALDEACRSWRDVANKEITFSHLQRRQKLREKKFPLQIPSNLFHLKLHFRSISLLNVEQKKKFIEGGRGWNLKEEIFACEICMNT